MPDESVRNFGKRDELTRVQRKLVCRGCSEDGRASGPLVYTIGMRSEAMERAGLPTTRQLMHPGSIQMDAIQYYNKVGNFFCHARRSLPKEQAQSNLMSSHWRCSFDAALEPSTAEGFATAAINTAAVLGSWVPSPSGTARHARKSRLCQSLLLPGIAISALAAACIPEGFAIIPMLANSRATMPKHSETSSFTYFGRICRKLL